MSKKNIAILTSTKPLRKRFTEGGREVERLDPSRLLKLTEAFDSIIIGSRAHEDFFARIRKSLSRKLRRKFLFYPRGFFDRFVHTQKLSGPVNDRDEGWKEILRVNDIDFASEITVQLDEFHQGTKHFRWTEIEQFVRDDRVSVIGTGFFEGPTVKS